MPNKILYIVLVLLLATVMTFVSGVVVFALGAGSLAAVQTGGGAFVVVAGLGLGVLKYLTPTTT
ncbi:hypothetical protein OG280_41095 (plasmid) [Streptomyces virginiae]|uniref:hypothetical protein n=1 Tax=Streptomyces virginiae TaxID=1961 RepID=UPI002DDB2220|nr:hypothetical protein [Streptomyces virginiae]WSC82710.1 hypothetical protein OHA56_41165 [Streptomyces virginiae]